MGLWMYVPFEHMEATVNSELLTFHAHAQRLLEHGIEPRLLVAAIQLQLPTDLQLSTKDKLDALVALGKLVCDGDVYSLPTRH